MESQLNHVPFYRTLRTVHQHVSVLMIPSKGVDHLSHATVRLVVCDPACCPTLDSFDQAYIGVGMWAPYGGGIF